MIAYTSSRLPLSPNLLYRSIEIKAIYALAPTPYGGQCVPVRVLNVHFMGTPARQYATVQIAPGRDTYEVFTFQLKAISVQVAVNLK